MEQLRSELTFKDSYCPKIGIEIPKEPDAPDNLTLTLKAELTPEIADALGIGYVYIGQTSLPEDGFRDMHLQAKLSDVELKLKSAAGEIDTLYPELISKFFVFRIGDAKLGVRCEAETVGNFNDILDFFRSNREGFEVIIRSRQGDLFEGGTRVEMSSESTPESKEAGTPKRGRGRPKKSDAVTVN